MPGRAPAHTRALFGRNGFRIYMKWPNIKKVRPQKFYPERRLLSDVRQVPL